MNDRMETWARTVVWALPVWGTLLAVGTLSQQPDYRTEFADYADYITTSTFLASHLVASIAGAAVGLIGMVALFVLTERNSSGRAALGVVLSTFGQVGLASVFGAAAFAQPAIGRAFLGGDRAVAEAINADVYGVPLSATAGLSILLFVAGGILLGTASRRVPAWPRWAGSVFAASVTVFAAGVFVEVPFVQPLAGLGIAVAGAAIARAAGIADRPRPLVFADEVTVR
jgi:hypothetical protein